MSGRRIFTRPARIAAVAPYLWMALFFLVPFGFVLKISLSQTAIAQPPYLPVFEPSQGFAAIKAALAKRGDDAGDRAVLDLVSDPHLCLDQYPAARRPAQQGPARAASGVGAGGVAVHRQRDVSRHRLLLFAVHDPAALCDAGQNGSGAAGGRRRSRRL